MGWTKNPEFIKTACLGFLMMIYFPFWSSKIHILSLLLLLHCFLKLVSIKTADLSPATGLLLLSNSFFPFQFLTKSAQSCGLVKTFSGCARSHFTYSNWPCDSKKVREWNIINLKSIGWEMSRIQCHSLQCFKEIICKLMLFTWIK